MRMINGLLIPRPELTDDPNELTIMQPRERAMTRSFSSAYSTVDSRAR